MLPKHIVVADAGHGGGDTGTTAGGLIEKSLNLATALAFKAHMEANYEDVEVILTRSSDVDMSLKARPAIANRLGGNPVFVSFHHNSGGDNSEPRGFEAYVYGDRSWVVSTGKYDPTSFAFVKRMEPALQTMCNELGLQYRGLKDGDFQVIRDIPQGRVGVLFESFFATNPQDVEIAKRDDFADRLGAGYAAAFGLAMGLTPKAKAEAFVDVPNDAWYADCVKFLADAGIVHGTPDGKFEPDRPISRAEAAKMARLVIRYITGK